MDLRFRGLPGAIVRRFSARCGSREQQVRVLARLMELYADGQIDPFARDPYQAARGALGGQARAALMTPEARSEAARYAAQVRWRER